MEKIGVSISRMSHVSSGETKLVNSFVSMRVANEFKVSADYILGLSTMSIRKSYDISGWGLFKEIVRGF